MFTLYWVKRILRWRRKSFNFSLIPGNKLSNPWTHYLTKKVKGIIWLKEAFTLAFLTNYRISFNRAAFPIEMAVSDFFSFTVSFNSSIQHVSNNEICGWKKVQFYTHVYVCVNREGRGLQVSDQSNSCIWKGFGISFVHL